MPKPKKKYRRKGSSKPHKYNKIKAKEASDSRKETVAPKESGEDNKELKKKLILYQRFLNYNQAIHQLNYYKSKGRNAKVEWVESDSGATGFWGLFVEAPPEFKPMKPTEKSYINSKSLEEQRAEIEAQLRAKAESLRLPKQDRVNSTQQYISQQKARRGMSKNEIEESKWKIGINTEHTAEPKMNGNQRPGTKSKSSNNLIAAIIVILIFVLGAFAYSNLNGRNSSNNVSSIFQTTVALEGAQSNPFPPNINNTLTWQGAGYYTVPLNVPASGLKQGVDQLSIPSQVDAYNQWVSQTSTISTSVSTTVSTSTVISSVLSTIYSTTISQTAPSNAWATQFFQNVSSERGTQYNYCPVLSQFAQTRFNTMAANYGISHYGYAQDFDKYWPNGYTYGNLIYTGFAEEVFFPTGQTPNQYVSYVMTQAPAHWELLLNSSLIYYGYYIGNGPAYEILGPDDGYGGLCPVTEIPGPNINISQFFAQYGCSVQVSNQEYFVIEIAAVCPTYS